MYRPFEGTEFRQTDDEILAGDHILHASRHIWFVPQWNLYGTLRDCILLHSRKYVYSRSKQCPQMCSARNNKTYSEQDN